MLATRSRIARSAGVLIAGLAVACSGSSPSSGDAGSSGARGALSGAPAIRTVAEFAMRLPDSTTVASADGARLVHASGFSVDTGLARADEAAATFLAGHGAAFGVTDRHELTLLSAGANGPLDAIHVGRTIGGLPVFGGDLVVGVSRGKVFAVNSADVPPAITGSHAIGPEVADAAARASLDGTRGAAGPAIVAAGWRPLLGSVRAVYRVDLVTEQPAGDFRVWVDGETGRVLFAVDRIVRATAPGQVYEVSPVETAASLCPSRGGGSFAFCARPVDVVFAHLDAATSLIGSQTRVWNCRGADAPDAAHVTTACSAVAPISGSFAFPSDGVGVSATDDFAAAMAYYHLDRHASFFKALDPALPGNAQDPPGLALNGSLPALVNVKERGEPFDNAYFSPGLGAMVFGQGTEADFAYDATVMYHEFTHGVVDAWGGFDLDIDGMGGLDEPGAVNEGTADAMAASETGRSAIGAYVNLRSISDPAAARSCKGNGKIVTQLWATGVVNGMDGEVHDDGQIWGAFFWEVHEGLKAGGWVACAGGCEAAPAIQYAALKLGAGTHPTFATYWLNMRSAATALFPSNPEVAAYVECVAKRRALDRCDRTLPLHAGESKVEFVRLRYSPFQISFTADASGTGGISFSSAFATSTTVHLRKGSPVALTGIDPATLDATVTSDTHFTVSATWAGDGVVWRPRTTDAGTWYVLLDVPGVDIFKVKLSSAGFTARPAAVAPPTCTPPVQSLTIDPAAATVAPGGSLTFHATGGSGGGYAWSLQTNASGGSIDSSGAYTAGSALGVKDVVKVTDSALNVRLANVSVATPSAGGGDKGGGCDTGEGVGALSLLAAAPLLLRRRRAETRP